MFVPPRLDDVRYADAVVVGRITEYRIVRDPVARRSWREYIAKAGKGDPRFRDTIKPCGFLTDYARFTILVDGVLLGTADKRIRAVWNNSTFGEPGEMPSGPFLIALRGSRSPLPPLRGPSGFIPTSPDPDALTPLQAPCSSAFIFAEPSEDARKVRAILRRGLVTRKPSPAR